jgi:hypothetical protein
MTSLTRSDSDPSVFYCKINVEPILRARGVQDAVTWIQTHPTEASSIFKQALARELAAAPFVIPPTFTIYYSYFLPDDRAFHQRIDGRPGEYSLSPLYLATNHPAP